MYLFVLRVCPDGESSTFFRNVCDLLPKFVVTRLKAVGVCWPPAPVVAPLTGKSWTHLPGPTRRLVAALVLGPVALIWQLCLEFAPHMGTARMPAPGLTSPWFSSVTAQWLPPVYSSSSVISPVIATGTVG